MKVFGWAADLAGCGYYRLGLPLWNLREHLGVFAQASTVMPDRARTEADVIVGQRVCTEGPTSTWSRLKADGHVKLVFEVDDDLWHVHPDNELAASFFNKPDIMERLSKNISASDLVTVSTEPLADVIREVVPSARVAVLPNFIDAATLEIERPRRDKLTIGWSGSFTHLPDFSFASRPLTQYFRRNPQVDMHFIGTTYSYLIGKNSRVTPWSIEVAEYHLSIDFDIGIIPLAPDKFNRSKSYIKALEYASLGIPVVASDYGPYSKFVKHGETGFLVRRDHEWIKYLNALTNDEQLREDMGKAAREYAADFTIQRNGHLWRDAYKSLLE